MTEELSGRGVLKQALARVYEEESAVLAREASNAPQPKLSETFTERMEALIRSTEEQERLEQLPPLQAQPSAGVVHPQMEELQAIRKTGWRRSKRAVRRLIVVAVLLAVMVPAGVFGAYRPYVNYQMTLQEDGRGYDVVFEKDENGLTLDEFTPIIPTTPEGFEVVQTIYDELVGLYAIDYESTQDPNRGISYLQRYILDEKGLTKDAEVDEERTIRIDGIDVYVTRKQTEAGDFWSFNWAYNNQDFSISGNAEYEQMELMMQEVFRSDVMQ